MRNFNRFAIAASMGVLTLAAAACTPAESDRTDETADDADTRTVVETREVPVPTPPVVVDREVPVPAPPVVVDRRDGDSTTIRAGEDGLEVETTNR